MTTTQSSDVRLTEFDYETLDHLLKRPLGNGGQLTLADLHSRAPGYVSLASFRSYMADRVGEGKIVVRPGSLATGGLWFVGPTPQNVAKGLAPDDGQAAVLGMTLVP